MSERGEPRPQRIHRCSRWAASSNAGVPPRGKACSTEHACRTSWPRRNGAERVAREASDHRHRRKRAVGTPSRRTEHARNARWMRAGPRSTSAAPIWLDELTFRHRGSSWPEPHSGSGGRSRVRPSRHRSPSASSSHHSQGQSASEDLDLALVEALEQSQIRRSSWTCRQFVGWICCIGSTIRSERSPASSS